MMTKSSAWLLAGVTALAAPFPAAAQTPPTYSFDTGTGSTTTIGIGGSPADANVAASSTHVCVTARAAFACYTKGGALVSLGPAYSARPYTAKEFFEQEGLGPIVAVDGGTNYAKDGRILFDSNRQRFFLVFQSREAMARLLIAVSKSEDPRDGWRAYADTVGTAAEPAHDYQHIGVSASHLLVSSAMVDAWSGGSATRWRLMRYGAAALASGSGANRTEWSHPDASHPVPCLNDSYSTDSYWVERDDATHATVWKVSSGNVVSNKQVAIQTSTSAVDGIQLGGDTVTYTNIGRAPQNCQYHNGRVVFVSNDGHTWSGQSSPNDAVRVVRLNVADWPGVTVEIDRIFGRANVNDAEGSIFDYGWPAVAINGLNDIVVGSIRSNSTIYPELRASIWFNGDSDISPSALLKASTSPLSSFHMAGAAPDAGTSAVYLAQQYGATSPSWRINVSKMLGSLKPDLIATSVVPPASAPAGGTAAVQVTILNQGDGPMPASTADLYLSEDNFIKTAALYLDPDPVVATFSVPALAANASYTAVVTFTVPGGQAPGTYYVGAAVDASNAAGEYSGVNNTNPFLGGNRGNAPMLVQ